MRYGSMKVTQTPPVHVANLVANSGNTTYGVDVIVSDGHLSDILHCPEIKLKMINWNF